MIPLKSKLKRSSNRSNQTVLTQLLNCLGSGVLLGLALLDILPELRESISKISTVGHKEIHYPLGIQNTVFYKNDRISTYILL